MTENVLEKKICQCIKKRGGKAFKWLCPSTAGVPDRIAIFPQGNIIFIEVKRPDGTGRLSKRQQFMREKLEALGCMVWVVDSLDWLERSLEEYGV